MNDFLQKLKKVVRIVLYGPAISQSDCRKSGLCQLHGDLCTDKKHVKRRSSGVQEGLTLSLENLEKRNYYLM